MKIEKLQNKILDTLIKRTKKESRNKNVPIIFGWNNIYILPNKFGVVFFAISISTILSSLNNNNNLGFLFGFFLFSFAFVAIFKTHKNLKAISITKAEISNIYQGQDLIIIFDLKSKSRSTESIRIKNLEFKDKQNSKFITRSDDKREIQCSISELKRGKIEFLNFKIETTFPYGLFKAWSYFQYPLAAFVYPKKTKCELNVVNLESRDQINSLSQSKKDSFGETFSHHLDYEQGTKLNLIDWKMYQSKNILKIKNYESFNTSKLLSINIEEIQGDFEKRLSKMSYLLSHAQQSKLAFFYQSKNLKLYSKNSNKLDCQKCLENLAQQ